MDRARRHPEAAGRRRRPLCGAASGGGRRDPEPPAPRVKTRRGCEVRHRLNRATQARAWHVTRVPRLRAPCRSGRRRLPAKYKETRRREANQNRRPCGSAGSAIPFGNPPETAVRKAMGTKVSPPVQGGRRERRAQAGAGISGSCRGGIRGERKSGAARPTLGRDAMLARLLDLATHLKGWHAKPGA